jgi:rhamnogalacturonyl hydrolase YesR
MKLSCNNKWLRIFYTQAIKECPFNIRPILKVEQSRNPKGIALFARAYLYLYKLNQDNKFIKKAENLLDWLLECPSVGSHNLSWGYNYIWQSPLFLQRTNEPNAVVTVFVGEAFIQAFQVTGKELYLEAARSVAHFICDELPVLFENEDERAIAYVKREVKAIVLNNQVLTGAFLAKVWKLTGEKFLLSTAVKQIRFTVQRRTDDYAWFYTFPSDKSLIRHDNYHTGGVLDGLLEYYEETGDNTFMNVYWNGLQYYQQNLFERDGAPRWMNDKRYPHDVHGSAQGIITFSKAARHDMQYLKQAEKIADWAIQHLYDHQKFHFIYRVGRLIKWNYSLMRWCNAWMTRALAELTLVQKDNKNP